MRDEKSEQRRDIQNKERERKREDVYIYKYIERAKHFSGLQE